MNTYSPIIFEEIVDHGPFQPATVGGVNSEWIFKYDLQNLGNAGEISSINVEAFGSPGSDHGMSRFSFWIANYNFGPLITSPRTQYQANRGPFSSSVIFWSGDIPVGRELPINAYRPIYSELFSNPITYVKGSGDIQIAMTAVGTAVNTSVKFTIKGRRAR
jgi:hypothetical protein